MIPYKEVMNKGHKYQIILSATVPIQEKLDKKHELNSHKYNVQKVANNLRTRTENEALHVRNFPETVTMYCFLSPKENRKCS